MDSSEQIPDVDAMARSMLVLYGPHDDHDHEHGGDDDPAGLYTRTPRFPVDSQRYQLIRAATERDSEAYLYSGLAPVACRRCGATVQVKKLGPAYTAVQWNSTATQQCAYFAEQRERGSGSSRTQGCPQLSQSIKDAVADGLLEETCSSPPE